MKRKILSVLYFSYSIISMAQQDPQYTQFVFNKQMFNPAVTGKDGRHCATLFTRTQYTKYEDQTYVLNTTGGNDHDGLIELYGGKGSKTVSFSYGAPIPFTCENKRASSGGIGLSFYGDETGYLRTSYYKADLAYRLRMKNGEISFGANLGFMQKVIDINGLIYKNPLDPKIPTVSASNFNLNYGFGLLYSGKGKHGLNVGYAMQNLSGQQFAFAKVNSMAAGLHQYFSVDFETVLKKSGMVLSPFALVQTGTQKTLWYDSLPAESLNFANPTYTVGSLLDLNPLIQVGVSSRFSHKNYESVSAMMGIYIMPNLRIGYAYDLNVSGLRGNNNNTHEIMLKYCFSKCKSEYIDDPRHLDRTDFERKHI